jgi:hypothetical protein
MGILPLRRVKAIVRGAKAPRISRTRLSLLKPNALPKPSDEPSLPVSEASQMSFVQAFQYAVPQSAEFAIQ